MKACHFLDTNDKWEWLIGSFMLGPNQRNQITIFLKNGERERESCIGL